MRAARVLSVDVLIKNEEFGIKNAYERPDEFQIPHSQFQIVKDRPLGRTGLTVSAVSLGTVALGVDYGIGAPGEFGRPGEDDAVRLVQSAIDRGVTLVDTAPAYGDSERIVGRAVGGHPAVIVATKVNPAGTTAVEIGRSVIASIESSLRTLGRDALDIVQIHNATRAMIADGAVTEALADARRRGLVRAIGASVYGEDAAMAVIQAGEYTVLQVALNALDQRMRQTVLPAADAAGIGVIVRSAFLKGALTPKAQWLPEPLAPLRDAAARARDLLAGGSWERLPDAAMRFCLSLPGVASVLTGARTATELEEALAAEAAGPLDASVMRDASRLAMTDEHLLNPSYWPVA
jgi:aryl-alcohol dehydrogenase-like predicted oxidoreductase